MNRTHDTASLFFRPWCTVSAVRGWSAARSRRCARRGGIDR